MGNSYPKKQKPLKISRIIKGLGVSNWWSRGKLNLPCKHLIYKQTLNINNLLEYILEYKDSL